MCRARISRMLTLLLVLALPAEALPGPEDLRVYVVVVDGLHPDEVTPDLAPNLAALRAGGTWYENALAVMIAETLPNHVAMMTGVPPQTSGIVANTFLPQGGSQRDMDSPDLLQADTLVTRIEDPSQCPAEVHTATVLSKTYLYGIFCDAACFNPPRPNSQKKADFHWKPDPVIPLSNHAPDLATMEAFLGWIERTGTPQFAFVNLGDVDRSGHADPTGNGPVAAFRQASLTHTDLQIGRLVDGLEASQAWESTVLIIVSDHSMDWSLPHDVINLTSALGNAGFQNKFTAVQNGGADMVYVPASADVEAIANTIRCMNGVELVLTSSPLVAAPACASPALAELRSAYGLEHPNAGQVIAFAKQGFRFSEPTPVHNPIPGNHGHAITQRSVLLVAGGHPVVKHATPPVPDATLPASAVDRPGNLSVAPTVAKLLGLAVTGYANAALDDALDASMLAAGVGPCGP